MRQQPGFEFFTGLGARDGFSGHYKMRKRAAISQSPNRKHAQVRTIRPRRRINLMLFGRRILPLPP